MHPKKLTLSEGHEQEALAAAKREEADIKAHYDGHGHGAA
jgi:hypothetical protein